MPWNPSQYNTYKDLRYQPFFDLMNLVSAEGLQRAVDIGCGTGEQTSMLATRFSAASFLGIDASAAMLAESKAFESGNVSFKQTTTEQFADSESNWDLIFSNAALQWSDNHPTLFPKLIEKLNPGGQFAVQMPCQKENVLNRLLFAMVNEKRFAAMLDGFARHSPLLTMDEYATMMFDSGLKHINLFIRMYPIVASNEDELYNFIAGSALIPYMERLDTVQQSEFSEEFRQRIRTHYAGFPAIYAFKRILMYSVKA